MASAYGQGEMKNRQMLLQIEYTKQMREAASDLAARYTRIAQGTKDPKVVLDAGTAVISAASHLGEHGDAVIANVQKDMDQRIKLLKPDTSIDKYQFYLGAAKEKAAAGDNRPVTDIARELMKADAMKEAGPDIVTRDVMTPGGPRIVATGLEKGSGKKLWTQDLGEAPPTPEETTSARMDAALSENYSKARGAVRSLEQQHGKAKLLGYLADATSHPDFSNFMNLPIKEQMATFLQKYDPNIQHTFTFAREYISAKRDMEKYRTALEDKGLPIPGEKKEAKSQANAGTTQGLGFGPPSSETKRPPAAQTPPAKAKPAAAAKPAAQVQTPPAAADEQGWQEINTKKFGTVRIRKKQSAL